MEMEKMTARRAGVSLSAINMRMHRGHYKGLKYRKSSPSPTYPGGKRMWVKKLLDTNP